jgi:hypothetical protein
VLYYFRPGLYIQEDDAHFVVGHCLQLVNDELLVISVSASWRPSGFIIPPAGSLLSPFVNFVHVDASIFHHRREKSQFTADCFSCYDLHMYRGLLTCTFLE